MTSFLDVAQRAARLAGDVLLDWAGRFSVSEKGPADLVTEADVAAQTSIQATLLGAFPGHGFLGEENLSIASRDNDLTWIVDPLDGTTNYVHSIPHYAVSIALAQGNQPIVGVVFDPVAKECFAAMRGRGATLNGKPMKTSGVTTLDRAVTAVSSPPGINAESQELKDFLKIILLSQSMRRSGSSALNLSYIAAGRYDAYWSLSAKPWDVAAGFLLVAEAGGHVIERDGSPIRCDSRRFVAAASSELSNALRQTLDG
ncbi:MAG: inositol monophosphatase [Planctomycetes bacterium]|nr:inositol monophosphatase [Planctomycetota bacterium]